MDLKASLQWESAAHALVPGEECGDASAVFLFDDGALLAVLDGLGHGPEAARASQMGLAVLESRPQSCVTDLMQECHKALRKTRGAVATLAQLRFSSSSLTWLGVGNVDAGLFRPGRPAERVIARGGVIGHSLPRLSPATFEVASGDFLVMSTDGLQTDLLSQLNWAQLLGRNAASLLAQFAKQNDDALVLVAELVDLA